jgi:hypothetical protein
VPRWHVERVDKEEVRVSIERVLSTRLRITLSGTLHSIVYALQNW